MRVEIVITTNPDALDAIEARRPRLVRQSEPGVYAVVSGPPVRHDSAWHARQVELYRDGATRATNEKDVKTLRLMASIHDERAKQ